MAQANWTGLSVSSDDLAAAGTVLWNSTTEGFTPPAEVQFSNVGVDVIYLHVVGIHIHPSDTDQSGWTFTRLAPGESIKFFSVHPARKTGTLSKAWAWTDSAGTGTLVWTPITQLNGEN